MLLPVWNAAATLPACLDSLARQSLRDFEIVAVDDGSSDGSRELLRARAHVEPRLVLLEQPHRGLVAALETGNRSLRAPFVARMDADDVAHPQRLALQLEALERDPRLALVGSRVRVVGERRGAAGMRAYVAWSNGLLEHGQMLADLLVESPLVHPSVTLRTRALLSLGGYRAGSFPEDYDLWLRAAAAGLVFAKRAEVLLDWRDSPGRLTRRDPRYAPERFRARKLDALQEGALAGRAALVWGAGKVGKAWARDLVSRGIALAGFAEVAPRKLGQRIHDAPVLRAEVAARVAGPLHLLAVGQPGARARMRALARANGLVEGADFVAVA